MSDFRKLAHLEERIGPDRFQALLDPNNTGKVKKFCDELILATLPTEITVGGRTYEILSYFKKGEDSVRGDVAMERAKEMNANLGREDHEFIYAHGDEIPVMFRGRMGFVFTDYRNPSDPADVVGLFWDSRAHWTGILSRIRASWNNPCYRVLRRKAA